MSLENWFGLRNSVKKPKIIKQPTNGTNSRFPIKLNIYKKYKVKKYNIENNKKDNPPTSVITLLVILLEL